jgi:hypothetical protein
MRTPVLAAFVGAAALATAVSPAVASAAPHRGDNGAPARAAVAPAPVTATTLADWTFEHTEYVLRQITVAPGASTGWHAHAGQLYGYVEAGALTHPIRAAVSNRRGQSARPQNGPCRPTSAKYAAADAGSRRV